MFARETNHILKVCRSLCFIAENDGGELPLWKLKFSVINLIPPFWCAKLIFQYIIKVMVPDKVLKFNGQE
jgi:hypothetical protein